jgi:hypothetical protein
MTDRQRSFVLVRLAAGPLTWSLHFGAVYGFVAVLCAREPFAGPWRGATVVTARIVAITIVALVALVPAIRRAGPQGAFLEWLSRCLAALAALAIVWEALVALLEPTCSP